MWGTLWSCHTHSHSPQWPKVRATLISSLLGGCLHIRHREVKQTPKSTSWLGTEVGFHPGQSSSSLCPQAWILLYKGKRLRQCWVCLVCTCALHIAQVPDPDPVATLPCVSKCQCSSKSPHPENCCTLKCLGTFSTILQKVELYDPKQVRINRNLGQQVVLKLPGYWRN